MSPTRHAASEERAELMVQLQVQCPSCGRREARRVAAWRVELYRDQDPSRIADSVGCKCGAQYLIRVAAYQGAA